MEIDYAIAVALVFIVIGVAYLGRDRARERRAMAEQFNSALDRIAAGEKVRLDPPTWGGQARQISAFNLIASDLASGQSSTIHGALDHGALFRRLREELALPEPPGDRRTFVGIAEINRFATLRRGIGFELANQVLRHVSGRISETLDRCDIGRIGRTTIEFGFSAASVEEAGEALQRLSKILEQRLEINGFTFDLPISIGFADASHHSVREELVDQAAAALAKAQASRQPVVFADHSVEVDQSFDDLSLMRDLPGAMRSGEIELHYQPKLRSRTNRIDSAEALVRWFHPVRGQVATDRFVELAEGTGAIRDLTEWALHRAVSDQLRLAAGGRDITIYVNISGVLLPDADFVERAVAIVSAAPGRIGLEITETAVITDPDRALANLKRFAEANIKIAIDDYGSGLSSLAYLKQLPAHELKIDRMFVSGLIDSHRDPLLVRSSIDLAHALDMEVTAEGVDDPMVLSLLRVMGCDLIQGYLISPPMAIEALELFLADDERLEQLGTASFTLPGAATG